VEVHHLAFHTWLFPAFSSLAFSPHYPPWGAHTPLHTTRVDLHLLTSWPHRLWVMHVRPSVHAVWYMREREREIERVKSSWNRYFHDTRVRQVKELKIIRYSALHHHHHHHHRQSSSSSSSLPTQPIQVTVCLGFNHRRLRTHLMTVRPTSVRLSATLR